MKKGWRKLKQRLERIGWGKRIVFNLFFIVFFLCLTWVRFGCPLPTAEMEFRRMERTCLLPESEIIFDSEKEGDIQWRDLPNLSFHVNQQIIGVEGGRVHAANLQYGTMEVRPLGEGLTPVPLYNMIATVFEPGNIHWGVPLLFLNVPEETARAEIVIGAAGYEGEALRYQGEGWRLAPGRWMFAAYPGDPFTRTWHSGGSYTLRLYQEDGSLLLEQSGIINE